MQSVHNQLALRKDFDFLHTLPAFDCLSSWARDLSCKTVCIGKLTRRGRSALAGIVDNQSKTW